MAGEGFPRRLLEDRMGGVGHDLGRAALAHGVVAAERELDRRGGDAGARPERVEGDARRARNSSAMPSTHSAHAEFRHRVGDVRPNQFGFMSSGGDSISTCGFAAFCRCGMQAFEDRKVPRALI